MNEAEWQKWIRSRVRTVTPVLWVLPGKLACSPRPLRYHTKFGGRVPVLPPDAAGALSDWLHAIRREGIATIACLATPGELKRYVTAVGTNADLISLYGAEGLVVYHHPIEDPFHAHAEERPGIRQQLERLKPIVFSEYRERSGGFLVHCSGGMDRAAPIAAFIAEKDAGRFRPAELRDPGI